MGFKTKQKNLTFSDLENTLAYDRNRSLKTLMELDKAISWGKIEEILLKDYPVGDKKEGNRAYSPLLLFKCLLLQKWFRIKSDPELESRIIDRNSFRRFLSPASVNDTNYLVYCTLYSCHVKHKLSIVYADKGYHGEPNRTFLAMNNIKDGIMRKNEQNAGLTEYEIERNKVNAQ